MFCDPEGKQRLAKSTKPLEKLVGVAGFEPAPPCSQSRCATRLRHTPNLCYQYVIEFSLSHIPQSLPWGKQRGKQTKVLTATPPKCEVTPIYPLPCPGAIDTPHPRLWFAERSIWASTYAYSYMTSFINRAISACSGFIFPWPGKALPDAANVESVAIDGADLACDVFGGYPRGAGRETRVRTH